MKTMQDVKDYIRKEMRLHTALGEGREAAGELSLAQINKGKVQVLLDLHQKLCIYFPQEADNEPKQT